MLTISVLQRLKNVKWTELSLNPHKQSSYTVDPRLTGPQLSESSDYPEGKYLAHAQTIPRGRLVWRSPTLTERFGKRSGYARLVAD